jgi:hypothetical protein
VGQIGKIKLRRWARTGDKPDHGIWNATTASELMMRTEGMRNNNRLVKLIEISSWSRRRAQLFEDLSPLFPWPRHALQARR